MSWSDLRWKSTPGSSFPDILEAKLTQEFFFQLFLLAYHSSLVVYHLLRGAGKNDRGADLRSDLEQKWEEEERKQ